MRDSRESPIAEAVWPDRRGSILLEREMREIDTYLSARRYMGTKGQSRDMFAKNLSSASRGIRPKTLGKWNIGNQETSQGEQI